MLMIGLVMVVYGGEIVAFGRYTKTVLPNVFWWTHTVLLALLIVWSQWSHWRSALRQDDPMPAHRLLGLHKKRELGLLIASALSIPVHYALRELAWAAPAAALAWVLLCWLIGRFQMRSYPIAVAGWLLAGAVAALLPWPSELRFGAVGFLGGVAMVLQGAWDIIWRSRTAHREAT